ncbi:MAG: Rpn family recombination-promoting nuclease/putative transposase [Spirochaetia bacterium]|nr:Rpn family recombination-promoting nuclease/putative transposase [Spirochaetia bacterium]
MIDVAFKYLFGTEKNKNLLKVLLENVFDREIEDISYDNTEQIGESLDARNAYFDVLCRAKDGPDFIVECQVRPQEFFAERAVFYASRTVANNAPKGEWDYDFRSVYFLGLINFPLPDVIGKTEGYFHSFSLRNDKTHALMTDKVRYAFMEVATFNKRIEECQSFQDEFLFYMKNLPTFVEKPDTRHNQYFEELLHTAEYLNMDMETQAMYEKRLKEMRDIRNVEEYARRHTLAEGIKQGIAEGLEKGMAEGLAKGHEKGLAEGLERGMEQGMEKGLAEGISKVKEALKLLRDGYSAEEVSEKTGLSLEDVRSLQ